MKTIATAAIVTLGLTGCTFEDGQGFATLETASLSARLEPGAGRDLGDHSVLTSQGYRVALTRATLEVDALALNQDDTEAELAGGGAQFSPVATLPAARGFDLLQGQTAVLDLVLPSRELPQARITQLALRVDRLELEGSVSGGPPGGALEQSPAALIIALPIASSIDTTMSLAIDRDEPGAFSLSAALEVGGTLFDELDFNAHESASRIEIVDLESAPGIALARSLLDSAVTVSIQ
jgi:hypothetical protein